MSEQSYQCLICCSLDTTANSNCNDNLLNEPLPTNSSLLSQNLEAIFILSKLLQVPRTHLEDQLKESGSDPTSWIRLCEECRNLTKTAIKLQCGIRKIERQLWFVQKQVIDKIKSSQIYHDDYDDQKYVYQDRNLEKFEDRIRSFVKTHNYTNSWDEDNTNKFLQGDKLAKYLASQQNSNIAQILLFKVENPGVISNEEIKVEVDTPASPFMSFEEEDEQIISNFSSEHSEDNDTDEDDYIQTKRKTTPKYTGSETLKTFRTNCPICEKGFVNTRVKNLHMLSIHKDDPVSLKLQEKTGLCLRRCTVNKCKVDFLNKAEENKHMKKVHNAANDVETQFEFKCKHCKKGFRFRHNCIRHEQTHKKKESRQVWKCDQCEKGFTSKKARDDHINGLHLNKFSIICPICEKGFAQKRGKDVHLLTVHKDDPVTIKMKDEEGICLLRCWMVKCGSSIFLRQDELDKHIETKHGGDKIREKWAKDGDRRSKVDGGKNGQVFCGECGTWYYDWIRWTTHFWKVHEGKDFVCPGEECEMGFKAEKDKLEEFKLHFEMCHETKKITCNICGQEMVNREMLKKHKRIEHYEKQDADKEKVPWICDICGIEKNSWGSLSYHRKSVHKVDMKGEPLKEEDFPKVKKKEEKVLCNLCGKEYSGHKSLDIHLKLVHEKQFSLSCHVCGLAMPHKRQLNVHLLSIHKEDPVTRQLEVEKGLTLIRCEVVGCSRVALKQEEMDKHFNTRHGNGKTEGGDGSFKCKYCGKGFWMKSRLVYHERVHEKDRNNGKALKCESCGKGFDTKHYLRCHQRRVHKY